MSSPTAITRTILVTLITWAVLVSAPARAGDLRAKRPDAVIDLMTVHGAGLVAGQWRYADARVIEAEHRAAGADLKPSGAPNRTLDIEPKAGSADFDHIAWQRIDPTALTARRGNGRLSFAWYAIDVTIPERIGQLDATGATAVFEIVVDDYAEVWVNGALPRVLGQSGGPLVAGYNAPNRVVLTRNARPGQTFRLAIFTANGPLSDPPPNYIWIRSATLDFYRPERAAPGTSETLAVERIDPALDDIVPPGAQIEKLADGFTFTEGPVWVQDGADGHLLFSDPNENVIYRWSADDGVSIYRTKSGYAGIDIGQYRQPGSNGLALDPEGRLTICEHGNRRVTHIERNGVVTVLADGFDGKRLNSPNDLVYRSDGTLFFTDPPFGLPQVHDDPRREQESAAVYSLRDGVLRQVSTDLTGPNGIALSPDEKHLYVANWDTSRKIVMRYVVQPDGTLTAGIVFFDVTAAPGEEALDGLKVDERGNVYVSAPGGVWIVSPAGRHLGTLKCPELPANFAWGDGDGKTLYIAARTGLYRVRLDVPGVRHTPRPR